MELTPSVIDQCERIATMINKAEPRRKHSAYIVMVGNFSVQAVRRDTQHGKNMMRKHPDRLVGVYEPGVMVKDITDDVKAMSVRPITLA